MSKLKCQSKSRAHARWLACVFIILGAASSILLSAVSPLFAASHERILSFNSHITVATDGSMVVKETITAQTSGDQIKRGIYRDFPTRYNGRFGESHSVGFDLLEVLKDGVPEPYHMERLENGSRVYIGEESVFLPQGQYTYTITYTTDRQLGFFEDHDEMYWNVTGTGWVFPIDMATATVVLPKEILRDTITTDGYTGSVGSKEKDYKVVIGKDGAVAFTTIASLKSYQGLTIVVGWPKGFVQSPTQAEKFVSFAKDNAGLVVVGVGFFVVLAYYALIWIKKGRDPKNGIIIPMYEPPVGFSPASLRYIVKMKFDDKVLAAAIVDMAVKKFLTISDDKKDDTRYVLTKTETGDKTALSPDEEKIADEIFAARRSTFSLRPINHRTVLKLKKALQEYLRNIYAGTYFLTNTKYWIIGFAISVSCAAASWMFIKSSKSGFLIFMLFFFAVWAAFFLFILKHLRAVWRLLKMEGVWRRIGVIAIGLAVVPFLAVGISRSFIAIVTSVSFLYGVFFVGFWLMNYVFYILLKKPTHKGRELLDAIQGFKWFLTVTEKDRLNFHNPPEKTPALFEKFLPYAIALDVEHAWADQFADVFSLTEEGGEHYAPAWYHTHAIHHITMAGFASAFLGGLSSAIASASTPPGSRSGFGGGGGGGGSSGGGGGGGGGGGW